MGAAIGMRRFFVATSAGGLALLAIALPVSLDDTGRYLHPAVAAAEDGNGAGTGQPVDGSPTDSTEAIADDQPATTNVIRELSGLPQESELSDEEEREAIRNGWGTWRTADGPETLLAQ